MNQLFSSKTGIMNRISLFFFLILMSAGELWAQLDIDVDIDKKDWYEQPWAWVVGAALFILILVALLRRPRK